MNEILKRSLKNSVNYSDYKRLMEKLVLDKYTTGDVISEEYINYTKLNERRMKRWDKKLSIDKVNEYHIKKYNNEIIWLVITESWCDDAAHVIPVINKIAELNDNINLRIVLRDDNEALMNRFLTNNNKSIPKLIMVNAESFEIIDVYGPMPSIAEQLVKEYKKENNYLTPEYKEELQRWYNKDKGKTTIKDLVNLLN